MPPRRVFLSPDFTLLIPLARLRALFTAFGWPRGLAKSATHRAIARHLFGGELSAPLADLLEEIVRLAGDSGRRALYEGARATHADTKRWPADDGDAAIAAHVVAAAAKGDEAAARVVKRAHIRLNRLHAPRMTYDLAASTAAKNLPTDAAIATAMGRVAARALDEVWSARDDEGRLHVAILYRAPAVAEVVDKKLVTFSPLRSDALCIDFDARRVSITTATPEWLAAYGEALGLLLWGDAQALLSRPSLTFKPPQEWGAAALVRARMPTGVHSIAVTAWLWDAGDGTRTEVRSDADALAAWGDVVRGTGGYFRHLNVRVGVTGAPHPVDVVMQLPNIVRISDVRFERAARAAVAAVGLFAPGAVPDDAWTLAPFVHPEWRWRMVLGGAALELLVKKKMLVPVATKKLASKEFRTLAWSVSTHDVPGEPAVKYAVTEDRSAPARDVTDEARVMLRLDVAAVGEAMRVAIGAVATAKGREIAGGVDVGELAMDGGTVRVVYAMTRLTKGFADGVQRACGVKATPLVLVPEGRKMEGLGFVQVELGVGEQVGIVDGADLRARIGEHLGVDEPGGARPIAREADLVVERATGRVWLFGLLMSEMAASGEKLVACLLEAGDRAVSASEAGAAISPSSANPDSIGRNVRMQIDRWIAATFARAGRPVPPAIAGGLIVTGSSGGYRLVIRGVFR